MVTRRNILKMAIATTLAENIFSDRSILIADELTLPVEAFPLVTPIPHPLSSCSEIEQQILFLEKKLTDVRSNVAEAGEILKSQVLAKRKEWNKILGEASSKATVEQKTLYVNASVTAAGMILSVLSVTLTSAMAIGFVTGGIILLGPIALVAHSIAKSGSTSPALILGYTRDRTLALSGLVGDQASSTAGRIIGKSMIVTQIGLDVWNTLETNKNLTVAVSKANIARQEIVLLDKLIKRLGKSNARWANLQRNLLEGSIRGLKLYVSETKAYDCKLQLLTPQGPVIKSLP